MHSFYELDNLFQQCMSFYGVRSSDSFSLSLEMLTTIFQAEVIALTERVKRNIDRGYNETSI